MVSPIRPMALRSAQVPSFVAMTTSLRARIAPLATGIAALVVATSAAVVVGAGYTSQLPAVRTIDLDTSPAPVWATLPPCAAEDGPGPCVWHAESAGNGLGTSFYIGADFCTYRLDGTRDDSFPCEDAYASPLGDAVNALEAALDH